LIVDTCNEIDALETQIIPRSGRWVPLVNMTITMSSSHYLMHQTVGVSAWRCFFSHRTSPQPRGLVSPKSADKQGTQIWIISSIFWGVELHLTQIKYKQTREGNITPTILLRKMEIKRKILQCMSIRFSIYAQKWLQMQSLRRIHQSFGYLRSLHHEILLLNFTIWNLSRTAIKLQAFLGGKEWRTKVLYLNINWAAVILATEIGIA